MSVIYLVHPVHGAKVAIDEAEAAHDEMFGWERFEPKSAPVAKESPAPAPAAPVAEEAPAAPVNAMPVIKRRGRARTAPES